MAGRGKGKREEKREIRESDCIGAMKFVEEAKKEYPIVMEKLEKAIKERNHKVAYDLADNFMGNYDNIRAYMTDEPYGC